MSRRLFSNRSILLPIISLYSLSKEKSIALIRRIVHSIQQNLVVFQPYFLPAPIFQNPSCAVLLCSEKTARFLSFISNALDFTRMLSFINRLYRATNVFFTFPAFQKIKNTSGRFSSLSNVRKCKISLYQASFYKFLKIVCAILLFPAAFGCKLSFTARLKYFSAYFSSSGNKPLSRYKSINSTAQISAARRTASTYTSK